MKRFVEGIDRGQATLFPECLADWTHFRHAAHTWQRAARGRNGVDRGGFSCRALNIERNRGRSGSGGLGRLIVLRLRHAVQKEFGRSAVY